MTKKEKFTGEYGRVFWGLYFFCIILISIISFMQDVFTRLLMYLFLFLIMLLITAHFWARSDYPKVRARPKSRTKHGGA